MASGIKHKARLGELFEQRLSRRGVLDDSQLPQQARSVGFRYGDPASMMKRYNPETLSHGYSIRGPGSSVIDGKSYHGVSYSTAGMKCTSIVTRTGTGSPS